MPQHEEQVDREFKSLYTPPAQAACSLMPPILFKSAKNQTFHFQEKIISNRKTVHIVC